MSDIPRIPGYTIEKKLGEGGMAAVFMGTQEKENRKVAIKILEPALLRNEVIRTRFINEAETSGMLKHPNIISILEIGEVNGYYFIIMEYLEETLKERLFGYPDFCMKPKAALEILKPIIRALEYAHEVGIIHRDIKTDNIMFRKDSTPVLLDFGIARALDSDNRMTRTGISLGTPYYMSPEQCKADPQIDGRSDIYSLGVVFYEMIMGSRPYEADNPTAVAIKHLQEPVPRLPPELSSYQVLIDKMMAKDKENRTSNEKELINLIDAVLSSIQDPASTSKKINEDTNPAGVKVPVTFIEKTQPFQAINKTTIRPAIKPTIKTTTIPQIGKRKSHVKTVVGIAAVASLLIVVFIIFFNLGAKKNNESSQAVSSLYNQKTAVKPVQPTPSSEPGKQDARFRDDYNQAVEYFNNSEYDKALTLVQNLKSIKSNREVDVLEGKITRSIKEIEDAKFINYLAGAKDLYNKKNYEKAKENILQAKKIKTTPELEELEKQIDLSYTKPSGPVKQKPEEIKASKQLDDQAFEIAIKTSSIDAYRTYMRDFPAGRHFNEAMSKVARMEEAERQAKESEKKATAQKLRFRSNPTTLKMPEVESMIRRNDFYDDSFNKSGAFRNKYIKEFIDNGEVLKDEVANLMWYSGAFAKSMAFNKAAAWVRTLNRNKYAGFSDWRLPTLEEAASLLRKKNVDGIFIDPIFQDGLNSIWTGDQLRPQTYWIVRFYEGKVYPDSDLTEQQTIAVRSITQ